MKIITKTTYLLFSLIFLVISSILLLTSSWLTTLQLDVTIVLAANLLLFLVTIFSATLTAKSFANPNLQASIRAVMLSFMVKFFVLAIAAFVYIYVQRQSVNLRALISAAMLYLIYTGVEVRLLLKALKK